MQVRALYDFLGDPSVGEMCITAGEILTVTTLESEDGWLEGQNCTGEIGLFPQNYVELIDGDSDPKWDNVKIPDEFDKFSDPRPLTETMGKENELPASSDSGWYFPDSDGEKDSDKEDTNSNDQKPPSITLPSTLVKTSQPLPPGEYSSSNRGGSTSLIQTPNKFFSRCCDSYMMGSASLNVTDQDYVYIISTNDGYKWHRAEDSYTVIVYSPKKETKFIGIKSFIAYRLKPSFNGVVVSRRYKHFDWLHNRLSEKFTMIPIPPLPDKQISGRYEEQFIEHRRAQLQEFVDWICRHPVLSRCNVWMHFLTATEEKSWKQGKRIAEKDNLIAASFCATVLAPTTPLSHSHVDSELEFAAHYTQAMIGAIKNVISVALDQVKKREMVIKADFQRISNAWSQLARALEIDDNCGEGTLSMAVGKSAGTFMQMAKFCENHTKRDWIPFADRMHIYRGVLDGFPSAFGEHKFATSKRKDLEKFSSNGPQLSEQQLMEVNRRVDVMSYTVMAEVGHFRGERDTHFRDTYRIFIAEQIKFYQQIVDDLLKIQKFLG